MQFTACSSVNWPGVLINVPKSAQHDFAVEPTCRYPSEMNGFTLREFCGEFIFCQCSIGTPAGSTISDVIGH